MKKILTLALICLTYISVLAQNVPQGIAYQAVAVKDGAYSVAGQNPQAIYWSNKEIKVRFTILDKYPNGSAQYSEVHTTSTDDYGVFNLIIGQGSSLSGDFTTIPWELGDAHLQVEIDFENTDMFMLTALEKFWSVPYAFVANETGTSSTDSALAALNNKFQYLKDRDQDTVIGNEIQQLSLNNDTISLSNGGGKVALVSAWLTEGDTTSTFNQVGIGSKSTYPGVELILKDGVFASQVIETTGPTTDAELWLKNPTGTWRMHGDQSDANKLKFGLWTDYSEAGGSNKLPNAMTIDTLGNVGIGTANPSSSLHINSTSSKTGLLIENTGTTSAKIVLNQAGSANGQAYYLVSRNDGNFVIGNSSSGIADQFVINSFGNVGIGTKNPTYSLEVVGNGIGGSQALKLIRNRNKPNLGVRLNFNLLNSKNDDTKYAAVIGSIADSAAGAEKGFLSFQVADGSGTWSDAYVQEKLRIETKRVTVKNLMRLQPLSVAPASPLEGDIYMNSVSHKLMVYDGTTWQACW